MDGHGIVRAKKISVILLVCNDPFDVLSFGGNVKCMLMFELTAHV